MSVKIQIHGKVVRAQPVGQRPDGQWIMRILDKTGRLTPGTRVVIDASAVVEGTLPAIKTTEPSKE